MSAARPVYVDIRPEAVFGVFHPVDPSTSPRTAVLVCPPWGWDEVASYRSRREWAERLAAAGHPTLCLALPGTGNSAGSPRTAGRVKAWLEAIGGAASWLREASGAPRLAVLGLGLGGLLAAAACDAGAAIDELILWGTPASGKTFAREVRAFSRLQSWQGGATDADADGGLPEGWLEAGGFVLSADTLGELQRLAPGGDGGGAAGRMLLLDRNGIGFDAKLRERLEAAGAEATVDSGPGWAEMVAHAERSRLPQRTVERVAAWLAEAPAGGGASAAPAAPRELDALLVDDGERPVRERAFPIEMPFGRAFAILAEPAEGPVSDLCAVCLNAGAVRNIGPNRIWVETARRWAALGVRTLRLDLEGIGEADGERPPTVADFYLPKFEAQVGLALDALSAAGLGGRFLLAGLCGGGYWAFQRALADDRVEGLLLLNSGALVWDPELIDLREARKVGRASDPRWWGKLARGEVGVAKLARLLRSLLVGAARSAWRLARRLIGRGSRSLTSEIEADLDRLQELGTPLTMAFSDGEPLLEELRAEGVLDRLDRWPDVELATLPGSDHTLRPIASQAAARELLDDGLRRALTRPARVRG